MPLPPSGRLPDPRREERPGHGPAAAESSALLLSGDTGDLWGWAGRQGCMVSSAEATGKH